MTRPNPYAAPKSTVADAVNAQEGNFVPGGRSVPAAQSWDWIAEGWNLFKRQPATWIAMVVVLGVMSIVAALIPFVGSLALMVLFPVFAGGLMLGCHALEQGARLEFSHLFAGFRERFGALAAVGALYLGVSIVIALVVGIVTGASMFAMLSGGENEAAPAGGALASVLLAMLIMLALMIPLAMAVWFAAPLVLFHQRAALEAMKESFSGCLKNLVPFLLYGVILMVLGVLASLPFALGWLILGPVMAASVYTAYRSIYFT